MSIENLCQQIDNDIANKNLDTRYQPRKSFSIAPDTSLEAYDKIKPLKRAIQQAVWEYVWNHPNCTQEDAHNYFCEHGFDNEELDKKGKDPEDVNYASVRTRFSELCRMGLITEAVGERPIIKGTRRRIYIATGKTEPDLFNAKMTYKQQTARVVEFLVQEYRTANDPLFKERILSVMKEVGFVPVTTLSL